MYMYTYLSLSLYIYIYICIHTPVCAQVFFLKGMVIWAPALLFWATMACPPVAYYYYDYHYYYH